MGIKTSKYPTFPMKIYCVYWISTYTVPNTIYIHWKILNTVDTNQLTQCKQAGLHPTNLSDGVVRTCWIYNLCGQLLIQKGAPRGAPRVYASLTECMKLIIDTKMCFWLVFYAFQNTILCFWLMLLTFLQCTFCGVFSIFKAYASLIWEWH